MAENNTRIKTGRLMNPKIVEDLLGVIPPEDLKSLKTVEVRLSPNKAERKKRRRYTAGYYSAPERRIRIHLMSIANWAINEFGPLNNNLHDLMFEAFVRTLYHETGHHARNKNGELERLEKELERLRKSDWELAHRLDREEEDAADDYRSRMTELAGKSGLLETPPWRDTPFFKLWRDRFIKQILESPREQGVWRSFVGVCHHIRKCRLGAGVKYSFPELFRKVTGEYPCEAPRELARFKRFVLKHVQPRYYIAPTGRKYAYFTDADLGQVKTELSKVKPAPLRVTIESKIVNIDKSIIKGFLKVVPGKDLNGLEEIVITDKWIGGDVFYDSDRKKVGIYVPWVLSQLESQRRNVAEEIAFDIFHEIAHHVQEGDHKWDDFTKLGGIGMFTHRIDRTELYLSYEQFANAYAGEKLEKLRQTDPTVLSPYARRKSGRRGRKRRSGSGG